MTLTDITSKQTFLYWSHFSVCLETSCPVSMRARAKKVNEFINGKKREENVHWKNKKKKKWKVWRVVVQSHYSLVNPVLNVWQCQPFDASFKYPELSLAQHWNSYIHTLWVLCAQWISNMKIKKLKICFGPLLLYRIARINSAIHWCIASVVTYCRSYLFYLVYCWMAVGWFYTDPYQTQIILCSASSRLSLSRFQKYKRYKYTPWVYVLLLIGLYRASEHTLSFSSNFQCGSFFAYNSHNPLLLFLLNGFLFLFFHAVIVIKFQ